MLVIAEPNNQLANRLFNTAHVLATALECGTTMVNAAFEHYADHYPAMKDDGLCRFPRGRLSLLRVAPAKRKKTIDFVRRITNSLETGKLRPIHGNRIRVIRSGHDSPLQTLDGIVRMDTEDFSTLARKTSILFLSGPLFRNDPAFIRHQDAIRDFFTPAPHHLASAQRVVSMARAKADVVVGVHVRRGDYNTYFNGRFFYSDDTYFALMLQVAELFPGKRVSFVVCSNEPPSSESFPGLTLFQGPGHLVQDMHCLALCDLILGPPSTFSSWASFYGKVPVHFVHDPSLDIRREDFWPVTSECTRIPSLRKTDREIRTSRSLRELRPQFVGRQLH